MHSKTKIIGLSLVACLGLATAVQAGIITSVPQAAPSPNTRGFGGWNLENVKVLVTDTDYTPIKEYNTTDGSYTEMILGDSFESLVKDGSDVDSVVMGKLHGKDWPVGEPSGVKVLNDIAGVTHGKPENCILTTSYVDFEDVADDGFLGSATPTPTTCASSFQSHKRFKINLQPSTIDGKGSESVDMVFNVNAEATPAMRRYQVFQKINNYTGSRLKGYTVEVGFGVGAGFAVSTTADLNLSLGEGEGDEGDPIWDPDAMATFSHGLWGAPDTHFDTNGFFEGKSAGYNVALVDGNTIISGTTLGSNYADDKIFGKWLPSRWAPEGIFFDDDGNPETDAALLAFWGDYDENGIYEWTSGEAGNNGSASFAAIDETQLVKWAMNPIYFMEEIEDVLNLGLNYIVEVGDISTFTGYNDVTKTATFTIRITPTKADDVGDDVEPGWITNEPELSYDDHEGAISINPDPFDPGATLIVRVADADLNINQDQNDTVDINVTNGQGEVELITLTEVDVNTSLFQGTIATNDSTDSGIDNNKILNVTEGTQVTVTYNDADDGTGHSAVVTDTATATITPVDPIDPVTPPTNSDDSKGIFSTMDNMSLFAMIFGFLAIGGLIARKKLAK